MKRAILFLLIVLYGVGAYAQDDPFKVQVKVEEVLIAVDARLPNGDPINGLTVSDFTVIYNGVPVPIRRFEPSDIKIPREGPIDFPAIICNKGCLSLEIVKQDMGRLFTLLQKEDRTALYVMCPEPRQIAPFTSDVKELEKALAQVYIISSCTPRIVDAVTMATNDVVALPKKEKEHARVMGMLSGDVMPFGTQHKDDCTFSDEDGTQYTAGCDVAVYDGPELDRLVAMLRGNEIKFFDISHGNRPQIDLARESGGRSINANTLSGDISEAAAAFKVFRTRDITANRYGIMFTVKPGEQGTVDVVLSPQHGTLNRDYSLIVHAPCIRTATNSCAPQ